MKIENHGADWKIQQLVYIHRDWFWESYKTGTSILPSRCRGTGRGFAAKHQVRYLRPGQQPAPWTVGKAWWHSQNLMGKSRGKAWGNRLYQWLRDIADIVLLIVPPSFLLISPDSMAAMLCLAYGSKLVKLTIEIVVSLNRTQPIRWSLQNGWFDCLTTKTWPIHIPSLAGHTWGSTPPLAHIISTGLFANWFFSNQTWQWKSVSCWRETHPLK